jgi:hypothetical protein
MDTPGQVHRNNRETVLRSAGRRRAVLGGIGRQHPLEVFFRVAIRAATIRVTLASRSAS